MVRNYAVWPVILLADFSQACLRLHDQYSSDHVLDQYLEQQLLKSHLTCTVCPLIPTISLPTWALLIVCPSEEYLLVYSVYVLEASTSNRLTHFYPPLNLIPLIFIRPLRLIIPADKLRSARITLLKITHLP